MPEARLFGSSPSVVIASKTTVIVEENEINHLIAFKMERKTLNNVGDSNARGAKTEGKQQQER